MWFFILITSVVLAIDFYAHRKGGVISLLSASCWSIFYVLVSFAFAGYLYLSQGQESMNLFLTGYALEKALAFDNLFVFSLIFTYFGIKDGDQHRALHWGIAGAIIFRGIFVALGVTLEGLIGPVIELVFAGMIIASIIMILKAGEDEVDYDNAWYVVKLKSWFPNMTKFMLVVCVIEISDILFSFDSVPAIIAVTKDPFLVYSAMIFAILGLRSMYFVISALSRALIYIDNAVIAILAFIVAKLIASALFNFHIDATMSLLVILSILTLGISASLVKGKKDV